jgi:hypothetical protein
VRQSRGGKVTEAVEITADIVKFAQRRVVENITQLPETKTALRQMDTWGHVTAPWSRIFIDLLHID